MYINLLEKAGLRYVQHTPEEYYKSSIPINTTGSNLEWIVDSLHGNFSLFRKQVFVDTCEASYVIESNSSEEYHKYITYAVIMPCFEDSKDCMLYNLKWG